MLAVNEAAAERALNDRFGTGQSALDGILRATRILLAGQTVVVLGYGWTGRGVALRARGAGASVVVCEVDALRALEARMEGFEVLPAADGGRARRRVHHRHRLARRAAPRALRAHAATARSSPTPGTSTSRSRSPTCAALAGDRVAQVLPLVEQYEVEPGRRLNLLARGQVINLAAAQGHPAAVMDVSFAIQALSAEHLARTDVEPGVPPGARGDRRRGRAAQARVARRRDRRRDARAAGLPRPLGARPS